MTAECALILTACILHYRCLVPNSKNTEAYNVKGLYVYNVIM